MFDPWHQSKLIRGHKRLQAFSVPDTECSLEDLKRLAGTDRQQPDAQVLQGCDRAKIIRDNNLKPGTEAWFKAMCAKPWLTGEQPF